MLFCFVSESQAQTPSILAISQKEIGDAQGNKIQLSFIVSSRTDELELTKATFSDDVTTDASIKKELVTINNPVPVHSDKLILVSIPFGEGKAIQPKNTVATFTFTPKGGGNSGSPYTVNFIGSELTNVFQNIRKAADIDELKRNLKEKDDHIARIEKLLPQPKLEWRVVESYRRLRFEATTTKKEGATISIVFKCNGKDAPNERFISPDAPVVLDHVISDTTCDVAVSEKQPPTAITDRLLVSSTQGKSSFTTLKNDITPVLESNPAKQDKTLSQTKVFIPLRLSGVARVEADLYKITPGKPLEKVNAKEVIKGTLKDCVGKIAETVDRCQEDVTFEVPSMGFGSKYRMVVSGYGDDPLRAPATLTREFDSLPETFTKSILITFTKTGMKFTALTGDVESALTVAPEWANNVTATLPFASQTSKQSKDPFLELSPSEWLAGVSNQEMGASAPAASAPAPPKQLKINFAVSAKDGTDRVAKSSVTFTLDAPPEKKSNDLKNFVSKAAKVMAGKSSGGDAELSFSTVGGAIASLISIFAGL